MAKQQSQELQAKKKLLAQMKKMKEMKQLHENPFSALLFSEGAEMDPDAEKLGFMKMLKVSPEKFPELCVELMAERRRARKELAKARTSLAKAKKDLEKMMQPPLHPAWVIRVNDDQRVEVIVDGRRLVVTTAPSVPIDDIHPLDEVFLDAAGGTIVARSPNSQCTGMVGTVSELTPEGVLVRGVGDEQSFVMTLPEHSLEIGDRVVYARDFPCVLSVLPKQTQTPFLLEEIPQETFDDIGGLDGIRREIQRDLDLHLEHPELVEKLGLTLLRGITLAGTPGVGKTLLAKAIANYLSRHSGEAHFMHVKPGALRGIYFGQAEERIRDLFRAARNTPGLVVIFFDELDTFGSRGVGIGQDIDGRVLGALLSEIDGLEETKQIVCIGATNRLDLCDAALIRPGRLGDRIYEIPRPGRQATREILGCYLTSALPYAETSASEVIDAVTSYLHTRQGGAGDIATITFRSSAQRVLRAPDLLSGAQLAGAVERAKHAAAYRSIEASAAAETPLGIRLEDVLEAVDDALTAEAQKIKEPQFARQVLQVPNAQEIIRVSLDESRRIRVHRYLRAA